MKQIAAWILAWMLVFTLTGCGGKDASDEPAQEETLQTEEADSAKQPDNGSLTVVSDGLEETAEQGETLRGGTNQNDAVLLPLNTRLTGKATQEGGLWYAFTTGSAENATYKITAVNKTLGTGNLDLRVYDAYGKTIHDPYGSPLQATQVGRASTLSLELPPDTTYYIYIWSEKEDSIEYSLIIRDPEEQKTGYSTAGSVSEAVGAVAGQEISAGTNQDDGGMIPLEAQLSGKVSNNLGQWFAFTTNSVENATYEITTVNITPGTGNLDLRVYDVYGSTMHDPYGAPLQAAQDGKAATLSLELPPNTTYYIYIWADKGDSIQYTLRIHGPEEPTAESGTATVEQEPLVFETPFELNSTQVMFKAESDAFINEEAAKEALKPVAEVILAHPDHKILLAGTTATDGSQQARVELSNRRAAAVKGLLVSAFGVPEDQLLTIGLGFEADPFVRGQDRDANGKFVESEGAKNRRVVVMDVNDPIAQELLNS
ncbi:OmpA family protein [Oscillibacter valericigenes]|uniref:OmpA family protein n=1 Tax=Oscillibacter valericigenes TaxID=351091 RepID=A0ABS2FUZ3_9FIRM|nr:OmpA family protein [Oscillibacter valericigenes]MBM6851462.1 OmpA family protein [Oscillibacter valericigenes]